MQRFVRFVSSSLLLSFGILVFSQSTVWAESQTLDQAFIQAYQRNPSLLSARAQLRVLDERVSSSKSGWRPQVDAMGSAGYAHLGLSDRLGGDRDLRPRGMGFQVVQSVFKGFRTLSEQRAAEAQVLAGRAKLEDAEQTLFLDVARGYLNQLHAQKVLDLRQANEDVLRQQMSATQGRFKAGEVTQTDVSQSQSRLEGAIAGRIRAVGDLESYRATLARLLGGEASGYEKLVMPKLESGVEVLESMDRVLNLAVVQNPMIAAASHARDAAKSDVDYAKGRILPEINLVGRGTRGWEQSTLVMSRQDTAQIMAEVTIPLSHGGIEFSKARSAMQEATVKGLQLDEARHRVRESVIASWNQLSSLRASIKSEKMRVEAAQSALHGVRQEHKAGTRTTLDVLNAEQEVLDTKVALAEVERDLVLATLALRASAGQLTADKLKLDVAKYDPQKHYDAVQSKWVGFGD